MDDLPTTGPDDTPTRDASRMEASESIGPYRLLQMIGEGGMGEVWLADQTEPIRRRVALKVIKAARRPKPCSLPRSPPSGASWDRTIP